jgi:hypothetical protein
MMEIRAAPMMQSMPEENGKTDRTNLGFSIKETSDSTETGLGP